MSSVDARSLFAAAREDGPDASERDAVFRKIALTTGVAAGTALGATALSAAPPAAAIGVAAAIANGATSAAPAVASAAATGTAFGVKLLAAGAALGTLCTALGVLVAVTIAEPDAALTPARTATHTARTTPAPGAKLAQPEPRKRDAENLAARERANVADANAASSALANASAASPAGDLAEEARLVTAARTSLMTGDATRALSLLQATRKLSTRSLEPEELGLEARALRALGRADEAAATELVLRRRYPDHALAR
ncbi:MAG: hypothetical protein JWP87_3712 [Labilithrix sp.]|nr:hypothetical protein [Labilithrix sp.]